jgi:hypothetical protein
MYNIPYGLILKKGEKHNLSKEAERKIRALSWSKCDQVINGVDYNSRSSADISCKGYFLNDVANSNPNLLRYLAGKAVEAWAACMKKNTHLSAVIPDIVG